MKTYTKLLTVAAFTCFGWMQLSVVAAPKKGGDQDNKEGRIIHQLLEMSPEDLTQLRQTIERIEQMSPEQKEQMRAKLEKFNKMDHSEREAMRSRYKAIPEETREGMRQRWLDMSKEERMAFREQLRDLSHSERAELMEAEGIMPPPPRRGQEDKTRPSESPQKP